jgi:hypothetical protein
VSEVVSRKWLGLGHPPISQIDREIEYLFVPNQEIRRFGNRIHYNEWSMRSESMSKHKPPYEFRVLVLGDSVVNGGALTDQASLATTLLESDLCRRLGRPARVGNVSAGSWGPANLLAYVRRFGIFDADVVVTVLSNHDAWDAPDWAPVVGRDPDYPGRRPCCAVWEALTRYVPRLLGWGPPRRPEVRDETTERISLGALRELYRLVHQSGSTAMCVLHRERVELGHHSEPAGLRAIRAVATSANVPCLDLSTRLHHEEGIAYRDNIHLTARGQQLLEQLLMEAVAGKEPRGDSPGHH